MLPSRSPKPLNVFIEANTPSTSSCAPRFRVTPKSHARSMTFVDKIPLNKLGRKERLLILCGAVRWIFVVNLPENVWIKETSKSSRGSF